MKMRCGLFRACSGKRLKNKVPGFQVPKFQGSIRSLSEVEVSDGTLEPRTLELWNLVTTLT